MVQRKINVKAKIFRFPLALFFILSLTITCLPVCFWNISIHMVYIFSKFIVDWFQLNIVGVFFFFFREKFCNALSTHHNILELDTPLSIANCFYSTILLTKTNSIYTDTFTQCAYMYVSFAISMVYIHWVCKQIYTSVHSVSILN